MIHNQRNWIEKHQHGMSYSGRSIPYLMIFIGLYYILTTPRSIDIQTMYQGNLIEYKYTPTSLYLFLDIGNGQQRGDLKKIEVGVPYKKSLKSVLPNAKYVKIWTKKGKNILTQLEIDGKMIIPYNWWIETIWIWCLFIGLGLILLPVTEKSFQYWISEEKTDRLLSRLEMEIVSKLSVKSRDYNYYIVKENPLSKGNICVRLKKTKDKYPITLIYYTRNPQKTGDVSGETIRQFCYQLNFEFVPIAKLPVTTTDYASAGDPNLKKELGGHYRKFLEP